MSIATQITRLNNNIEAMKNTKQQIKDAVNNDFDIIANEQIENYDTLIENGLELYKQYIPPVETNQATDIQVTDAMKCNSNKLELFGNTSQATRILPEGYTQLDYIESTGTQYIDTGRLSTPNTKFEMDYLSNKEEGETFQCLFGSQNGVNSKRAYMLLGTSNIVTIHFPYSSGNHVLYMRTDGTFSGGSLADTVTINKEEKNKIIFDIPNKSVSVGQYTSVSTSTDTLLDSDHSILILARNDNTTPTSNFATGKLYRFKWYENNVLTMDFVPCKNASNVVGLYDLVSQTFFGNAGTGDFVAGNEVSIPNPDYPQPIHVVTGNNSIEVQGKNLLKINTNFPVANKRGITNIYDSNTGKNSFSGTATGNYPWISSADINTIPQGTTLTFSISKTLTYKAYARLYYDETNYETMTIDVGATNVSKTIQHDITRAVILLRVLTGETINDEIYLQLEQGSTPSDYEPYTHTDYPLNLGSIELCKIGDYQDYLYKENGNWYKYEAINKRIFDGSENWRQSGVASAVHNINLPDMLPVSSNASIYVNGTSDKFKNGVTYNQLTTGTYSNYYNRMSATNDKYMSFSYENTTTTASWKEWLSNNNVTAYYVLENATTTQITDETLISQLDAIYEHLQLVKGTNNITVTAADLAPYMKLSYKNYELTSNE